jgi:hypothetical protein
LTQVYVPLRTEEQIGKPRYISLIEDINGRAKHEYGVIKMGITSSKLAKFACYSKLLDMYSDVTNGH